MFVGENTSPTTHPRISKAKERFIDRHELEPHLQELRVALSDRDANAVRRKLRQLIEPEQRGRVAAEEVVPTLA